MVQGIFAVLFLGVNGREEIKSDMEEDARIIKHPKQLRKVGTSYVVQDDCVRISRTLTTCAR